MEMDDKKFEKIIKESGLKKPTDNFTNDILTNLPEGIYQTEKSIELWTNRLSWIVPAIVISLGLALIAYVLPLNSMSFGFLNMNFSLLNNISEFIVSMYEKYSIIISCILLTFLIFIVDIVISKTRSLRFIF